MNTAQQLSEQRLTSSTELAAKATNCKRLAGGLKTIISSSIVGELTQKEIEVLTKANDLLGTISYRLKQASHLKKKAEEDRRVREKAIRKYMEVNFVAMSKLADKVALIAAIRSSRLSPSDAALRIGSSPSDPSGQQFHARYLLDDGFRDCLDSVVYDLCSNERFAALAPDKAVAEAWQIFQQRKEQLQVQHASTIVRLQQLLERDEAPAKEV